MIEIVRYHHRFTFYDPDAKVEFTDLIEIHAVELKKLPDTTDGTPLYDWAKFIAAETEEEFEMAAQANPQVRRAVVKLRELSADEKARDMVERREKGERDFRMFINDAKREGEQKGKQEGKQEKAVDVAQAALELGVDVDTIIKLSGLTHDEVEALSAQQDKK